MKFAIRMGVPDMSKYWQDLCSREAIDALDKDELKIFKKIIKALHNLSLNPRYPGLNSHEIEQLSKIAGFKIWQSYLENKTPSAGRIFWAYGPGKAEITILGIEPHPEDRKKAGNSKVHLSKLPPL